MQSTHKNNKKKEKWAYIHAEDIDKVTELIKQNREASKEQK